MMELILLLIGVAVVLISAMLVFFISFKVMKESSFEEAAAEKAQRERKIEEELGIRGKAVKKDKKKKKEKKVKEVVKHVEETELTAGSSDEAEELEPSRPVVIESKTLVKGKKQKLLSTTSENVQSAGKIPEKTDSKKLGKASQSVDVTSRSSGNITGGEKNGTKAGGGAKANTAQSAKAQTPKAKKEQDDFQTRPEADLPFTVAESKHKKKKQTDAAEANTSSKSVVKETVAPVVSPKAETPAKVEAKKPAKEDSNLKMSAPKVSESVTKNVSVIQSSSIVATESGAEWTTETQKKPVDEKTDDLTSQLSAANVRYAELRQELLSVRQSYVALESRSREELAEKVKEIDSLKIRLNHTHVEHVAEMNQLNQQLRNFKGQSVAGDSGDGQTQLIKILSDENRKLKEEVAAAKSRTASAVPPSNTGDLQQKVQFMDDALKQNAMLLNASENAKKTLDQKLKQTEDKLKKMETQLKDVESKAKEAGDLLQKSETRSKSLSEELEIAKKEAVNFQEQLSKLKNEEQRMLELEDKTKSLESQFKVFEELIKQKDIELETLKRTAGQLTEDLKKAAEANSKTIADLEEEKKRIKEKNEEDEKLNSQIQRLQDELKTSESNKANLESQIAEGRQLQNKLEAEVAHYQAVLAETEKALTAIQNSVESEEKNWHQKLATVEDQLQVSREEVQKLTDDLEKLKNNLENAENGTSPTEDLLQGKSNQNHVEDLSDNTVTS